MFCQTELGNITKSCRTPFWNPPIQSMTFYTRTPGASPRATDMTLATRRLEAKPPSCFLVERRKCERQGGASCLTRRWAPHNPQIRHDRLHSCGREKERAPLPQAIPCSTRGKQRLFSQFPFHCPQCPRRL